MKSYIKEMTVMKKINEEQNKYKHGSSLREKFKGFPTAISFLEGS